MKNIQTLNKISSAGLNLLPEDLYNHGNDINDPVAILVRSQDMHSLEFPAGLRAIARAGAGVNNIPLDKCSQKGIVVFNTPGANANAVKELVILGILLASRNAYIGINWVKGLKASEKSVKEQIEKGKSQFVGPEIQGKSLAVIGLGAIGVRLANDAAALGMDVSGYDPYISVESAWNLSSMVKKADSLDDSLKNADYVSINVPYNTSTHEFMNEERLSMMKKSAILLNFSRAELVDSDALVKFIDERRINMYVTDFPTEEMLKHDHIIPLPHLGASTPEAEENCARMAVDQLRLFLEEGQIRNSVNYPDCSLNRDGQKRLIITNKNIPNMIGQITPVLADAGINIADFLNRSRGDNAYNIIDVDNEVNGDVIQKLQDIEGVTMVRLIS